MMAAVRWKARSPMRVLRVQKRFTHNEDPRDTATDKKDVVGAALFDEDQDQPQASSEKLSGPTVSKQFEQMWTSETHASLQQIRDKYFGRWGLCVGEMEFREASKNAEKEIQEQVGAWEAIPHAVMYQPLVLKVLNIDELNQTAKCEGLLFAKWHEPDLVRSNIPPSVSLSPSQVRLPAFPRISTAVEQPTVSDPQITHQRYPKDSPGIVMAVWEWHADLQFECDLHYFPFDIQRIRFILWWGTFGQTSHADLGRFVMPQVFDNGRHQLARPLRALSAEWQLYNPQLVTWNQTDKYSYGRGARKQGMDLTLTLARRHKFYTNKMLVMGTIASLSFCAFAANPLNVGERLSAVFTLLLSLITFKFSVSDKLPKVAYLTVFDKYMNCTIYLLCILAAYFSLIKGWADVHASSQRAIDTKEVKVMEEKKEVSGKSEEKKKKEEPEEEFKALLALGDPATVERYLILPALLSGWALLNAFFLYKCRGFIAASDCNKKKAFRGTRSMVQKPSKAPHKRQQTK